MPPHPPKNGINLSLPRLKAAATSGAMRGASAHNFPLSTTTVFTNRYAAENVSEPATRKDVTTEERGAVKNAELLQGSESNDNNVPCSTETSK